MEQLTLVQNRRQITLLHNRFRQLTISNTKAGRGMLELSSRGPGSNFSYPFRFDPESLLWTCSQKRDVKYYNPFGYEPKPASANRMAVQINYQPKFVGFRESAVWANDAKGKTYLLHSGKMGGGVSGIGKETVFNLFAGSKAEVMWRNKVHEFLIVCCIDAENAYEQLKYFVAESVRVKNILRGQKAKGHSKPASTTRKNKGQSRSFNLSKYSTEFWGKKKYHFGKASSTANANHGLVVDTLKSIIQSYGEPVNNKAVDLGLIINNRPAIQFEIKTSCSSQSIYAAIGQLLMHSNKMGKDVTKVFVAPEELDEGIIIDMKKLGIETILYSYNKKLPVFDSDTLKHLAIIINKASKK